MDLLHLSNPVFSSFLFCSSALILKMFFLALTVTTKRIFNKAFTNPEDATSFKSVKDGKPVLLQLESIERVRRNHLNDLENIPAFILMAFLYTLTGPVASTAILHFRVFTVARFLHTICYQIPIPQPSRALCFLIGIGVTASMAVQVLMKASF